jgi:hypothetical protein
MSYAIRYCIMSWPRGDVDESREECYGSVGDIERSREECDGLV